MYMNEGTVQERRLLRFENLSEIMPEVRRLAPAHRTVGNWSLGQTCQHLSKSFNGSVEGFDLSRHRIKRFFIKKRMLEVALTKGIPRNWLVDANLTPAPHVDLENGMADLEAAIERYREHRGGLHAHSATCPARYGTRSTAYIALTILALSCRWSRSPSG